MRQNLSKKELKDVEMFVRRIFRAHDPRDGNESLALTHIVLTNVSYNFAKLTAKKQAYEEEEKDTLTNVRRFD